YRRGVTFDSADTPKETPAPAEAPSAAATESAKTAITTQVPEGWWPGASKPAAEPAAAPATAATEPAKTAITTQVPGGWGPGASETAVEPAPMPATVATAPAPASAPIGGELTLTPETILAMSGVMGRLLTVVLALAAVAACWPAGCKPRRARRS